LTHETEYHWTQHSDHCAIISEIELPLSPPKAAQLTLPRADIALEICSKAAQTAINWQDFT
jgi:hypothetical protein